MVALELSEIAQGLPEVFEGVKKALELEGVLSIIVQAVVENAKAVKELNGALAPLQKLERAVDTVERTAAKASEDVKKSKEKVDKAEEAASRAAEEVAGLKDSVAALEANLEAAKAELAEKIESEVARVQEEISPAIESLQEESRAGVAAVQGKLDQESMRLDGRITEVMGKLNNVTSAVASVTGRPIPSTPGAPAPNADPQALAALEGRVGAAEERLTSSEEGISAIKKKLVVVKDQADEAEEKAKRALRLAEGAQDLEPRAAEDGPATIADAELPGDFDGMMQGVKKQMSDMARSMNAVNKKVAGVDSEVQKMSMNISEVSHHVDKVTGVLRSDMESQVTIVKQQVAQVEDEAVTAKQSAQAATDRASSAIEEAKRSAMKLDEYFTKEAKKPTPATQQELHIMLRQLEEVAAKIARQMPQVKDLLAGQLTALRTDLVDLSDKQKEVDQSEKDALRKKLQQVAHQVKEFAIKFGAITTSCVACGNMPVAQQPDSAQLGSDGRFYDHLEKEKKPNNDKDVASSSSGFTRQWEWCDTRTSLRKGGGFNTSASHFMEGMRHSPTTGSDVNLQAALALTKKRGGSSSNLRQK